MPRRLTLPGAARNRLRRALTVSHGQIDAGGLPHIAANSPALRGVWHTSAVGVGYSGSTLRQRRSPNVDSRAGGQSALDRPATAAPCLSHALRSHPRITTASSGLSRRPHHASPSHLTRNTCATPPLDGRMYCALVAMRCADNAALLRVLYRWYGAYSRCYCPEHARLVRTSCSCVAPLLRFYACYMSGSAR